MTEFLKLDPPQTFQLIKAPASIVEVWNIDYELPLFVSQRLTSDDDGASDGTTIKCSSLTSLSDYDGYRVRIVDKPSVTSRSNEERLISGATTGGAITVSNPFGGQIVSGVDFWIVGKKVSTAGPHNSDIGIDMRLHNSLRIWVDVSNMDENASVQLEGSHVADSTKMKDVGVAFTVTAGTYDYHYYAMSDGLLPWEEVEVTFAGDPTEAVFFAYAILKNI